MLDFDELRKTLNDSDTEMKKNIKHLGTMAKDAERVSNIAGNASSVINNIDRKFEQATQLTGIDVTFLFLATALQVVRQYLVTNFKERLDHNEAAKGPKATEKKVLDKIFKRTENPEQKKDRMNATHSFYRPSIEEVSFNPVPFDQTAGLPDFGLKIGGAFEHRAKTPGHDGILGYIVGTANIATATLTTWEWRSFHIKYGNVADRLKPMGTNIASTPLVFDYSQKKIIDEGIEGKLIIATALFREIMHLKSDKYSKVSLPVPIIPVVSPDIAKEIAKYGFDVANISTVAKQATYSILINTIIAMLHRLIYDYNNPGNLSFYEVRTRKILSYSNLIASASNVLAVATAEVIGYKTGNAKLMKEALKYLDIGDLMVTLYRLITDSAFIGKIKQEFLEKEFYNVVMGDNFDF